MQLSEEEKKVIEILTEWKNYNIKNKNKLLNADEIIKVQETILNLIKKQQKEIEEFKRYGYTTQILSPVTVKLNYIPKSKIEDKVKELKDNIPYLKSFKDWEEKDYTNEDIIHNSVEVLEELLESEE